MIVCVQIPAFAVAVERRHNPQLNDSTLILTDTKGKVFACCEASRRAGVEAGMRLSKARGRIPTAQIIPAVMSRYRAATDAILEALRVFSHKVEVHEEGVFYVDPGKLTQTQAHKIGQQIVEAVVQVSGLCASVGMAADRFTATIAAAQAQSGQVKIIHPTKTVDFLAPQPVSYLPLESETARRFALLGLYTLRDVQILPRSALFTQFGKQGLFLHDLANGRDFRGVIATPPRKSARHSFAFDAPVDNRFIHENMLGKLVNELVERIKGEACSSLTLNICTENRQTFEQGITPREPISTAQNIRTAFYGLLDVLLKQSPLDCGVVELHLILDDLKPALPQQLSLFDEPDNNAVLLDCLPHLIRRHGQRFFTASEQDEDSPLLERRYRIDHTGTA